MAMDVPLSNSSSSNTSAQDDPVESCSSDRDIHSRMVSELGWGVGSAYSNRRMGRI